MCCLRILDDIRPHPTTEHCLLHDRVFAAQSLHSFNLWANSRILGASIKTKVDHVPVLEEPSRQISYKESLGHTIRRLWWEPYSSAVLQRFDQLVGDLRHGSRKPQALRLLLRITQGIFDPFFSLVDCDKGAQDPAPSCLVAVLTHANAYCS